MAQQALEASSLVGQNRNRVHGQTQAELEPYRVYNLAPHRAGGYAPYGRRVRLQDASPANVTLTDIARLIGYDETGISSFSTAVTGSGTFSIFRGTTLHVQTAPSYSVPGDAIHLASAGAYSTRDAFLVLDRADRPIEPTSVTVAGAGDAGQPVETTVVEYETSGSFVDVAYGDGFFIAITLQGLAYRSSDDGKTWTQVADYSAGFDGLGYARFQSIDYGNGTWLIADEHWRAMRSTDGGDTWTMEYVLAAGVGDRAYFDSVSEQVSLESISYGWGDVWHATGRYGEVTPQDGVSPNTMGILQSRDGGVTWTSVESLVSFRILVGNVNEWGTRVAHGSNGSAAMMTREGRPFVNVDAQSEGTIGDVTWYREGDGGSTHFGGWTYTFAAKDRYVGLHITGQVAQSPTWEPDPLAISPVTNDASWSIGTTLNGYVRRGAYSPATESLAIVGGASITLESEPRIWQGETVSGLTRANDLEDAWLAEGGGMVRAVAFSDEGVAVYVGYHPDGSLVMSTDVAPGLKAGTYDLFYLAYANTPAGRFAFSLQREQVSFTDDNNRIAIQAQGIDTIIANNAWLAALPTATAEAIVGDLRLDVYIQYAATTADIDEEEVGYAESTSENTIRYAFTVPFPSGTGLQDVGRGLGALPIGRQLILYGAPTTVIFEKSRIAADDLVRSRTALHNGRVWGLARQDETPWETQGDDISLEIANQFNRFVLTYTETGWANLVSDQSFIPIQPTQSTNFTGIMGTPSGLMVMFDNEIFLVTGDPAFGNVTVDVYLDMAGCDLGTVPCMIGGIPFVIWDGKIWALQAGQAQEISTAQWRVDDPFVRICPEPQTRSLVGITESGVVLRYLIDDQFWMTDPTTRDAFTALVALPNAIDPDPADTQKGRSRIVDASGNVWVTYTDGTPDTPHLVYRDIDFGQPERRTPLYTAKVTLEGPLAQAEYDRDAVGYDATALPAMFYGAANANNGSTYETYDPQALGIQPVGNDAGARSVQTLAFRAPLRQTRSYSLDLRFELRGMAYTDTVKLPLRLFYAAGGATR